MVPQLRFSKDFDSFTVEPDHFDVVYGGKAFRLAYPINGERKFSVEAWGNTKLFFPEMLLECDNQDISHGILVNVQAGFEDVLMLGRFVEKLASVAGYQQVPVDEDNLSANTSCGSEYEDENDEEIDDANRKSASIKCRARRLRPILMLVEDKNKPFTSSFPGGGAGYFEITHNASQALYRFSYMHANRVNRTWELHPGDFGRPPAGRLNYLVHNVMLQVPHNPRNLSSVFELRGGNRVLPPHEQFVDLAVVDVFVDFCANHCVAFLRGLMNDVQAG